MNNSHRKNRLYQTIAVIIIITGVIFGVGHCFYSQVNENVSDVRKCTIIDNDKQFEYELQRNDGFKVALYGNLKSEEELMFEFMNPTKKFVYLSYTKYRYTMHTRRVKVGKSYTTQIYYTWDSIDNNNICSKTANMLGQTIDISDVEYLCTNSTSITQTMFKYGKVKGNYWYPKRVGNFVGNIRYSFTDSPNDKVYTIATNIRDGAEIKNVSERTGKLAIVGQKEDILNSLKSKGVLIIVITIVLIVLVNGFVFYKMYLE